MLKQSLSVYLLSIASLSLLVAGHRDDAYMTHEQRTKYEQEQRLKAAQANEEFARMRQEIRDKVYGQYALAAEQRVERERQKALRIAARQELLQEASDSNQEPSQQQQRQTVSASPACNRVPSAYQKPRSFATSSPKLPPIIEFPVDSERDFFSKMIDSPEAYVREQVGEEAFMVTAGQELLSGVLPSRPPITREYISRRADFFEPDPVLVRQLSGRYSQNLRSRLKAIFCCCCDR